MEGRECLAKQPGGRRHRGVERQRNLGAAVKPPRRTSDKNSPWPQSPRSRWPFANNLSVTDVASKGTAVDVSARNSQNGMTDRRSIGGGFAEKGRSRDK
jgi:hypothetical protein